MKKNLIFSNNKIITRAKNETPKVKVFGADGMGMWDAIASMVGSVANNGADMISAARGNGNYQGANIVETTDRNVNENKFTSFVKDYGLYIGSGVAVVAVVIILIVVLNKKS